MDTISTAGQLSSDSVPNLDEKILSVADNPAFDNERLAMLIHLKRDMDYSVARERFNTALSAAQAEIATATKNANNSLLRSRYADYASISKVVSPIIEKYKFAVSFRTEQPVADGFIKLTCIVSLGIYEKEYSLELPLDLAGIKGNANKSPLQAHGSAISYARRYLKTLVFDVITVDDDDDGNPSSEPLINREQAETINRMLIERNIDMKAFLRFYRVDAIHELRASQYNNAIEKIKFRDERTGAQS